MNGVVMRYLFCRKCINFLGVIALLAYSPTTWAYIGPGLGAGVIAAVIGIVGGMAMLIVGIVWYPLKRLIRRLRSKKM